MEEYTFGAFFGALCYKQGINPITKKETCKEWMNSCLNKLISPSLKRLAEKAPEMLDLKMYQLPSISQLMNLHNALEIEEPLEDQLKCTVCGDRRWVILINIETEEEVAARCSCMLIHAKDGSFAQDLLDTGEYVAWDDFASREKLFPEAETTAKKFMKRIFGTDNFNEFKRRKR